MFNQRSSIYSLTGTEQIFFLLLPKISTTSYGPSYFSFLAAKSWNAIPDHFRITFDFNSFRRLILSYDNIV